MDYPTTLPTQKCFRFQLWKETAQFCGDWVLDGQISRVRSSDPSSWRTHPNSKYGYGHLRNMGCSRDCAVLDILHTTWIHVRTRTFFFHPSPTRVSVLFILI